MTPEFGKLLMIVGGLVFAVGAMAAFNLLPWAGRLPGDISIKRENFSFYFPLVTCILVSVVLTLLMRLFKK